MADANAGAGSGRVHPMSKTLSLIAVMLLALTAAHQAAARVVPAGGGGVIAARRLFIAAMQRVDSHLADLPDPPILQSYPLYEYLLAARLRRDLRRLPGEALDATIDTFLYAHAHQPVAVGLRREWLASLAARGRWDWFLPRAALVADPQLICDRLQGRLATGDTAGLAADALARWTLPQAQPAECDPVFAWLGQQGLLRPGLVERRTRAALEAGHPRLAREFAAGLPADETAPLLLWAQLLETPQATLERIAGDAALQVPAQALQAGFDRLARNHGAAAVLLLPRLLARPQTTPQLRAQLWRSAALGAAYDRDPTALAAFAQVPPEGVDEAVEAWRVRAALWAGDYPKALAWIEGLPPDQAALPRWRYWYARAVAATAGRAAARPLYAGIAGLRDFYGYLAADRLHRRYRLNARPSPNDMAVQRALAREPGMIRAHELFACNMHDEAGLEWTTSLEGAAPAVDIQAAHLAARWRWYAESIVTLARAGEWDDLALRYPRPYAAAIAAARKLTRLPSDWILAIMREESLFREDAVSPADARGLMQMQPATARAVARRWHLPAPTPDSLFEPAVAAKLGAAYLRDLLDRYGGQLDLGLAAYNAGPAAVAHWLPATPMDADIWIENIPYRETRAYLQGIVEHIVAFAWTRGAAPPRLRRLLPRIDPAAIAGVHGGSSRSSAATSSSRP